VTDEDLSAQIESYRRQAGEYGDVAAVREVYIGEEIVER
jgi:hypothetical protein